MRPSKGLLTIFTVVCLSVHCVSSAEEEGEEEEEDTLYPQCWLKKGECLDQNVGPLEKYERPENNPNIVEVRNETDSLDDCVEHCVNNANCRYFHLYFLVLFRM